MPGGLSSLDGHCGSAVSGEVIAMRMPGSLRYDGWHPAHHTPS